MPLLVAGARLGHYELGEPLGHGGMGEVYRARDTRLDRDVAVKVLRERLAADADARARFEREAKAVAALSHPNILAIYDFGVAGEVPYSVTELLEGESLRDRLAAGPLPWRTAADIGAALADGLACAHARGIVHRDVKPENVFLTRDGRVKLLDFGLARSAGSAEAARPGESPTTFETSAGLVLGTMGYMAPEQARGDAVEAAADVFALGCVLHEMVSGRRAFERDTPAETLAAVLHAPVPALPAEAHAPPALSRAIEYCLHKSPERRFRSARDVAVALRTLLLDSGIGTPAPRRRASRAAAAQHSVAVLPFASAGDAGDVEFLGEGIAEHVINSLSGVRGVRVIPRSLAFRHAGRESEPRAVGVELNAETLLSGRVTVRGDQVLVQADLVDTSDESQIWGSRFVRPATDIEAVAAVLAYDICEALRGRFQTRVSAPRRARARAGSSPAYRDYLRGRHLWNKWSRAPLLQSIDAFKAAIDLDPSYAPAYAGLADAYGASAYYGYLSPSDVMAFCRHAAERALDLDPTLAEPHATLGVGAMFFEWDWTAAEAHLSRALALNPRCLTAQAYHALWLACRGQLQGSLEAARRAERLDPLSLLAMSSVAWGLLHTGDVEGAEAQLHCMLTVDAEFTEALGLLARLAEARRDLDAALRWGRRWFSAAGLRLEGLDAMAEAAAADGWRGYWHAFLDALREMPSQGCPGQAIISASIHAMLGDPDAALDELERAADARVPMLAFLAVDMRFIALHGHPRFTAILRRVGLA
jgi:TolB-like protein